MQSFLVLQWMYQFGFKLVLIHPCEPLLRRKTQIGDRQQLKTTANPQSDMQNTLSQPSSKVTVTFFVEGLRKAQTNVCCFSVSYFSRLTSGRRVLSEGPSEGYTSARMKEQMRHMQTASSMHNTLKQKNFSYTFSMAFFYISTNRNAGFLY